MKLARRSELNRDSAAIYIFIIGTGRKRDEHCGKERDATNTSNFTVLTERRKYYGKTTIGANQLLFINYSVSPIQYPI